MTQQGSSAEPGCRTLWDAQQKHQNCCQQHLRTGAGRQSWCHQSLCQCQMQPGLSPQDGQLQSDLAPIRDTYLTLQPEQQLVAQLVPPPPAVPITPSSYLPLDRSSDTPPELEPAATFNRCPSAVSSSTTGSSSSSCGGGGGSGNSSEAASSHKGTSCSSASNESGSVLVNVVDGPSTGDGAAVSIYDLYTPRRVFFISFVVALAALTAPLSNTIFMPAMKSIQVDLNTTTAAVTGSLASFQVAIGLGALLWGPASDKLGRRPILLLATALFALTNIPSILAPNILVLIIFRTLQGAAIAAYASAGPGILADICCPAHRGTLFGICSVAALLGPVLGPPLGGGLTQAFGWRSMFVLLAALSTAVILPALLWFVPETLQYKVVQQRASSSEGAAKATKVAEAETILAQGAPKFHVPWYPLCIVLDRQLVLHVLVLLLGYGTYICILAVMPFYLARAPYSLSTGAIGAVYLPGAFAAIFASPCGGRLADLSSAANMQQPLRRMVYSNLLGVTLMPLCMLLIGWGLHRGLPLAVALVALFVASFVHSLYMPALFTVVTITKQEASAAAVGGVYALLFLLSGTLMAVGTPVINALGLGPFLSILATLYLCCALAAFVHIIRSCSDTPELRPPLSHDDRLGSAAFARSAYAVLSTTFKQPHVEGECAAPGAASICVASADAQDATRCRKNAAGRFDQPGRANARQVHRGTYAGKTLDCCPGAKADSGKAVGDAQV